MKRIIESIKSVFRTKEQNKTIALNKTMKQIQFEKLFILVINSFNSKFTIDPSKPLYSDIENYRFYIKKENDKICICVVNTNKNKNMGGFTIKKINGICLFSFDTETMSTNYLPIQPDDLKRLVNKVVPKLI